MEQSPEIEADNKFVAQRLRLAELRNLCSEVSEIAEVLGVSERAVRDRLAKLREIEIAEDFLKSTGLLSGSVKSLKEFLGVEICPHANRDLDKICPDVVVCGSEAIGLELTAYGVEIQNRISRIGIDVSSHVRESFGSRFNELRDHTIFWKPNDDNSVSKSQIPAFTLELLNFVAERILISPLKQNEWHEFPTRWDETIEEAFSNWELLKRHTLGVKVCNGSAESKFPVSVATSNGVRYRSTRPEAIATTICQKIRSFSKAHKECLNSLWLVIHAARYQISSDIYPLFPQEIDRLLQSEAGEVAKQSDFDRVILWDGVGGGYVDLKNGDAVPVHS